jgi:hypothetical protein
MNDPRTTTTCTGCGDEIPPSLLDDALCVRCRYQHSKPDNESDNDVPTEYEIAADAHAVEVHLQRPKQTFKDALLCAGLDAVDAELASEAHEHFLMPDAIRFASEAIREIVHHISLTKSGKTPEFAAIMKVISGKPLATIAAETGHSAPSISYHIKRLPDFFLRPLALIEGDNVLDNDEPKI